MPNGPTKIPELPPQHPVAYTLRSRGFVPLPRLWVRSEDIPEIHKIAEQYREEVNAVRTEVGKGSFGGGKEAPLKVDPRENKDAAWETAERLRGRA